MFTDITKQVCSFNHLYKSANLCKRGVTWKDSVSKYVINKLMKIHKLKKSIQNGTYDIDKYIKFKVFEPKERQILSTKFKDRIFQKSIVDNFLYSEMTKSFIHDNAACQIGKGTEFARKRLICHLQRHYRKYGMNGYILKADLSNFFGSTSHELAYKSVAKRVSDKWILNEIKRIINSFNEGPDPNIGMGLGSQITQIIQLAVLDDFDHYVKEQLHMKKYIRYNDDFICMHDSKEYLKKCLSLMSEWINSRGLKLNPKKTQIIKISQGVNFLGFRFKLTNTGKVVMTLLHKKVSHERRKLKKMVCKVKRGELTRQDVELNFQSFISNISNKSKHKKLYHGKRAKRSCHGLELAMKKFYNNLWRNLVNV